MLVNIFDAPSISKLGRLFVIFIVLGLTSCIDDKNTNNSSQTVTCPKKFTCLGKNNLLIPSAYIFSPIFKASAGGGRRETILLIAEWPDFSGVTSDNEEYIYHGSGASRRSVLILLRPLDSKKWQDNEIQFSKIYDFHVAGDNREKRGPLFKAGSEFGLEKHIRKNSEKEKSINGRRAYIYKFPHRRGSNQSFLVCDGIDSKEIWKDIVDDSCSLYGRMGNLTFESNISRRHMMKSAIKIDDGIRKLISSFKSAM